jgi:hypothetical protein
VRFNALVSESPCFSPHRSFVACPSHFPGFVEHLVDIFSCFAPFLLPTQPARNLHFMPASLPTQFKNRQKDKCTGYSSCRCRSERVEEERVAHRHGLLLSLATGVETSCDTFWFFKHFRSRRPLRPLSIFRTFSRLFVLSHQGSSRVTRCFYVLQDLKDSLR